MNKNNASMLMQLKQSQFVSKRREAAIALSNVTSNQQEIIPHLVESLGDNEDVAVFATFSLVKIGKHSIPFLLEALHSNNERIRGYSAEIVGELQVIEAEESLINLIKTDKSKWVRHNAIEALGRIPTGHSKSFLNNLLHNADLETAAFAALALKRLGFESSIGLFLLKKLLELHPAEQGIIVWAIIEICSQQDLHEIIHLKEQYKDPKSQQILNELIQGISLR